MNTETIINEIQKLSVAQKNLLLEQAWDNLSKTPGNIPISEWQKHELDKRLETHYENPELSNLKADDVFKQLRQN